MKEIYPLTIIMDRYGGCYSGGRYLAFNLDHYNIPDSIGGNDGDEMVFWASNIEYEIGKGDTPQSAFDDLKTKINNKC